MIKIRITLSLLAKIAEVAILQNDLPQIIAGLVVFPLIGIECHEWVKMNTES
jgi:hypothetical protein